MGYLNQLNTTVRILPNLFLAMIFLFTSTYAQAAESDMKYLVDMANYNKSLPELSLELKSHFRTQEDHRQIDQMVESVSKDSKKWLWRYELTNNGHIALRVNGKVQGVVHDFNPQAEIFHINGQKVVLKKGQSFLSTYNNIVNILKKNQNVKLESLLIDDAHALAVWAIVAIAAAGVLGAVLLAKAVMGREKGSRNCNPSRVNIAKDIPNELRAGGRNKATFVKPRRSDFPHGTCNRHGTAMPWNPNQRLERGFQRGTAMPWNPDQRLSLVATQFAPNKKFGTYKDPRKQLYMCEKRKQRRCTAGGWAMSSDMAAATCALGQAIYVYCSAAPSAPVATVREITPCLTDKNGYQSCPKQPEPYYDPTPKFGDKSGNYKTRD